MALKKKQAPSEPGDTLEKELGEMLRHARESQGLDYSQLEEITKLRPHVLESLENEEWEAFSAPIFIKGFLRSYAGALKLDVEAVLRMYEEKNPGVAPVPQPLASLAPPRKRNPAFFIILILLAACAVFALHYYTTHREATEQSQPTEQLSDAPAPAPEQREGPMTEAGVSHEPAPEAKGIHKAVVETPERQLETGAGEEQPASEVTREAQAAPENAESEPAAQELAGTAAGETKPTKTEALSVPVPELLTLKAQVREKTWVKIILDQEAPREYIFLPGSRPQWKARQAFELVIGNAGGIALEFNGRKLDNLGGHGKVIHLRLPEGSERNSSG